MKIIAFLQNQWFKDPECVKKMYDRHPERRERYISAFLFMGCATGKRLKSVLGEDLAHEIIWEETSKNIGGKSSSSFPADLIHMQSVIIKHRPKIVLVFGKIARDAIRCCGGYGCSFQTIECCHPTARHATVWDELRKMSKELKSEIAKNETPKTDK